MKCPKCGYEWQEGHLYCDNCGEEFRIVPDFEPEIEEEMNETLSTLFVELAQEEMPEVEGKEKLPEKRPKGTKGKAKERLKGKWGRGWLIGATFFCILAAVFCIAGIYWYRNYSVSYQIGRAKECAAQEAYAQAIIYLERAHELDGGNGEILFLMADYYYIQEKYEPAVYILMEIVEKKSEYSSVDLENAYDKIISIYNRMEDYTSINELLLKCDDKNIVSLFQQYMAKPPEFSYVEGSYEEVLPLKLSANTSGTIYYTLDGSEPDENSQVYTAPIFLETGIYTVKACFVNDYGIKSDVVSNTYRIDVLVPVPPEVSVYSGDYYEPYSIEAQAAEDCRIYYTTDGTVPTEDSTLYTSAIPMPLGESVYKFVAISEDGVASDVIARTYRLSLNTEITVDMAISNVIYALVNADVLLDGEGNMRGMSGHNVYKFNSVIRIGEYGDYYVIYEYYEDATGIQTRTERIYGVNVQDGTACRITYDEQGQIVLVDI